MVEMWIAGGVFGWLMMALPRGGVVERHEDAVRGMLVPAIPSRHTATSGYLVPFHLISASRANTRPVQDINKSTYTSVTQVHMK